MVINSAGLVVNVENLILLKKLITVYQRYL